MKRFCWPKKIPKISKKKEFLANEFIKLWHENLKSNSSYNIIEKFNHNYSEKFISKNFKKFFNNKKKIKTLELGAGIGTHADYIDFNYQDYYVTEIRQNMIKEIKKKGKKIKIFKCDIQKKMGFKNNFFDRVNVIHVLEHLPNLPGCIQEVNKILKNKGLFQVVIPCDPGTLYSIARKFSAERLWRKNFKSNYKWFINREHINSPEEIIFCLEKFFYIIDVKYFPFNFLPYKNVNLCIGLTLKKKIFSVHKSSQLGY